MLIISDGTDSVDTAEKTSQPFEDIAVFQFGSATTVLGKQ